MPMRKRQEVQTLSRFGGRSTNASGSSHPARQSDANAFSEPSSAFRSSRAEPNLITVFRFAPPSDPRNAIGPQGVLGDYTVTFVLSRPGFNLTPERQFSYANGLTGDSHLGIGPPAYIPQGVPDPIAVRIDATTEDGRFIFTASPNQAGFLGKITSDPFKALSFPDAEAKAYRALAPSLSNWSVHLDIPLHIHQVDSTHVASGNSRMSMKMPIWEVPFSVAPATTLMPEFRGYASLYREAMDSNSSVYAFLCLFKIIEGIQSRRKRLAVEAKKAGTTFTRPRRRIPDKPEDRVPWLNAIFPVRQPWDPMALESIFRPEVLGKKFGDVIDHILNPLRVEVAHALSSTSGELTLSVDELLHIQKVNNSLPLTKCIARRFLKDEFPAEYLAYLREDGTIVV